MPSHGLTANLGQRTKKGTKITENIVRQAKQIESENLIIQADNAKVIANAINQAVMRALEAIGIDIEAIASDNAPVDTGRLAASITHALDSSEPAVYIGSNLSYALPVHEGTSHPKREPNRFLYKALNDNQTRMREIFYEALRNG